MAGPSSTSSTPSSPSSPAPTSIDDPLDAAKVNAETPAAEKPQPVAVEQPAPKV